MRPFSVLFVISFLLTGCQVQKNMKNLEFKILDSSQYGAEMTGQHKLITSASEFRKVHQQVFADITPQPEIPVIDFERKNVLFIHFGTFSHGGNTFDVDSIQYESNTLDVYLRSSFPGPGQPSVTVITHPFLLIELDKPAQTVEIINIKRNK